MTAAGGSYNDGIVFSINTDGTGYQNLFSFNGSNGWNPSGSLTVIGSTLYGMTQQANNGGLGTGTGNLFSINTDGTGFHKLLAFTGSNGYYPWGVLTPSGSTLYGMTESGGSGGDGTIFSINADGTGYQTLLSFNSKNGAFPYGSLILSGSTLYGMTSELGIGDGNVFSINTDGSAYEDLFDFNGPDGSSPFGSLILGGSTLYGMTEWGGSSDDGVVFSLYVGSRTKHARFPRRWCDWSCGLHLATAMSSGKIGIVLQDDGPARLAFPSHRTEATRRAA